MAQITRQRTGEYLRLVFSELLRQPEGVQAHAAIAYVESQLTLSDYEKGEYDSGGRRFEKILRFATVDCVKAGWMVKHKGRWTITDEGRAAYKKYQDPEQFHREAFKLYRAWSQAQPSTEEELPSEIESSAKLASITYEQADEQAWQEIEAYLAAMSPYDFQDFVAALIGAMGYHVYWTAPPGKDGGIDILAWPDPLGTQSPRIKVQVKRQAARVPAEGLRAFMAVLGEDDVGIFVASHGFTKDAKDEARSQEKRKITLLDLEDLVKLWIEYYDKLDDASRRRLPLQSIWFLAPGT